MNRLSLASCAQLNFSSRAGICYLSPEGFARCLCDDDGVDGSCSPIPPSSVPSESTTSVAVVESSSFVSPLFIGVTVGVMFVYVILALFCRYVWQESWGRSLLWPARCTYDSSVALRKKLMKKAVPSDQEQITTV